MACAYWRACLQEAWALRMTKSSHVPDYRCRRFDKRYNVYSGTVFEGRRLKPEQVVLLVRGVVKGEQAQILAREVGVCRQRVQLIRQQIQANARAAQPDKPLDDDEQAETDELYQNAGKKSEPHLDPADPPRRRANKQRGHGTYENDRPRLSVQLAARVARYAYAWSTHRQPNIDCSCRT